MLGKDEGGDRLWRAITFDEKGGHRTVGDLEYSVEIDEPYYLQSTGWDDDDSESKDECWTRSG